MPKDEQSPITREDLDEAVEKLTAAMDKAIRETNAEILRLFHASGENREFRFSRLKADLANLDQEANGRIDNVEKYLPELRLMAIEKRRLSDPKLQQ